MLVPHYQDSVIIVIGWTEIVFLKRLAEINDFKSATQLSHCNWLCRETLHWRHNEHDGVSNYQPHDCLLHCLLRSRWKKILKLRVTGRWPVNSPHRGPVTRKMFSFDDVIMILQYKGAIWFDKLIWDGLYCFSVIYPKLKAATPWGVCNRFIAFGVYFLSEGPADKQGIIFAYRFICKDMSSCKIIFLLQKLWTHLLCNSIDVVLYQETHVY